MLTKLTNLTKQEATLTAFLREIAYPERFAPTAQIKTSRELAIGLCEEFYTFLGPRSGHDWTDQYVTELIYLFSLIGESRACARLTLRDMAVVNTLFATL